MSSAPPPNPVCDNFNYSQWNATEQSATQAWVKRNFLSKVIADIGNGLISFVNGIKTNSILVYSGTTLSIGENDNTKSVNLYYPTLGNSNPIAGTNNSTLASTSWVNSWFSYMRGLELTWTQLNSYSLGIEVSNIDAYAISDTVNFISDAGARNNVNILNGNYTGIQNKGNLSIMGGTCDIGTLNGNLTIQNGTTFGLCTIGNTNSSLDLRAGTITLYKPLTPNYSYTADGTGSNKIGEIISGNYSGGTGAFTFGAGTEKTYSSITLTAVGVYSLFFQGAVVANGNITLLRLRVESNTTNSPYGTKYGEINTYIGSRSGALSTNSISSTIYNAGTRTYTATVYLEFAGVQPEAIGTNFLFLITRIA